MVARKTTRLEERVPLLPQRTSRLLRTSVMLAVMFIWRVCVRDEIGVWIAPAPIASQNIRSALFNRAILAIPIHAAIAVIHHGAPRRGGGLSRLQTSKAHSSNSNDGDENRAHQILITRFLSKVNYPLGQWHARAARSRSLHRRLPPAPSRHRIPI